MPLAPLFFSRESHFGWPLWHTHKCHCTYPQNTNIRHAVFHVLSCYDIPSPRQSRIISAPPHTIRAYAGLGFCMVGRSHHFHLCMHSSCAAQSKRECMHHTQIPCATTNQGKQAKTVRVAQHQQGALPTHITTNTATIITRLSARRIHTPDEMEEKTMSADGEHRRSRPSIHASTYCAHHARSETRRTNTQPGSLRVGILQLFIHRKKRKNRNEMNRPKVDSPPNTRPPTPAKESPRIPTRHHRNLTARPT